MHEGDSVGAIPFFVFFVLFVVQAVGIIPP
jgi:hypothetical protein